MLNFSGSQLEKLLNGRLINTEEVTISGFSTDTRTLKKGDLYIPLKGEHFDGHDFFKEAIESGAHLLLSEKETDYPALLVEDTKKAMFQLAHFYRHQFPVEIIGITGSDGKTTTKDIIASILKTKYMVHKTKENLNNEIGLCQMIFSMPEDTEIAILEMGMERFGEISLLSKIANPNIAVITNIGDSHLEEFETREDIARAKLEILEGLQEDGLFLYNKDDSTLNQVVSEYSLPENTLSFGESKEATFPIEFLGTDSESTRLSIQNHLFSIPLSGKYQIYNASVGLIIGKMKSLDYSELAKGLNNIRLTKMRNERIPLGDSLLLNDAYNASPQALRASLDMIYAFEDYTKKILILGDMLALGPREKEIHEEIGKSLDPKEIDLLIATGELTKSLAHGALEVLPEESVVHLEKEKIADFILKRLEPNSVIFVKGSRGMALETVVEEIQEKYNDNR